MSKSKFYPNELLVDEYTIEHDKDTDGHKHSVEHMLDPDYNKDAYDIIEMRGSSEGLKYDDKWYSYYWNCCAGSYFCNESDL